MNNSVAFCVLWLASSCEGAGSNECSWEMRRSPLQHSQPSAALEVPWASPFTSLAFQCTKHLCQELHALSQGCWESPLRGAVMECSGRRSSNGVAGQNSFWGWRSCGFLRLVHWTLTRLIKLSVLQNSLQGIYLLNRMGSSVKSLMIYEGADWLSCWHSVMANIADKLDEEVIGAPECMAHSTVGCSRQHFKKTFSAGIMGKKSTIRWSWERLGFWPR